MSDQEKEIWKEFTLLDFLKILGLDVESDKHKDEYYKFVGTINRFNRLLDHLYCEECDEILHPIHESNYAFYRVTQFICRNNDCRKSDKENRENIIYLHHCLNGKCNGIVDSRYSQKCPNGFYVCTNIECGCCCSHDLLVRRLDNLQKTGGFISENLRTAVSRQLGHLERAIHFCYKCGKQMKEVYYDYFYCNNCQINYDVSSNNFKRPNREQYPEHNNEIDESSSKDQGGNNNELPF